MLDPNRHMVDYVDDYLHEVLSPANAAVVEQHCQRCSACQAALAEARKRAAAFATLPASEAPERLIRDTLKTVAGHEQQRQHRRRWTISGFVLTAAAAVAILAGAQIHYLRLAPTPYDLLIAGQNRWFAGTHGSLRVRLMDRSSGLALAQVPVDIDLHGSQTGQLVHLASFTTNAQGSGEPRFRLPDWQDADCELRVTAHPTGGAEVIRRPVRLQRSWKLMLSSDKPVYQPGQEIHVRSLALRQADLKPVAGQPATFSITDPKGNLVFKHQEATSPYGISTIDYLLADEVIEGSYTIACQVGDSASKLTVDVKKYVLPKFKVNVELDQPYYGPGQTVRGKVRADYFFGKPVSDAAVEVEVRTTDVAAKVDRRLNAHTDAAGSAEFELVLPQQLIGRPQNAGDARVSFQVTVTDSAGQKQSRTVARTVTTQPLRVEVIPEDGTLVRGVPNTIYLFAAHADGRPARIDLVISGLRGWNQSRVLHTNRLGVASFPVTETMRTVDFVVEGKDPQPPHQTCRRRVHLESGSPSGDFLVRTDKAVYAGGDTMHLTALGGGQEPIFVDIIKDGQTFLTQSINLTDGRGEYPIDLPPELFGTVELCAYRFGAEGLPVRKTRTLYIHQPRQLNIRATLDQPEYRPGHHAKLEVALTDSQGTPTPGALSLAAVDEAVFSVLEQAPGMERAFFTLEQQLLKPVYTIYPWSPDQPAGLPPAEQNQFEQAIFARTARSDFAPAGANVKQPVQEVRAGASPLTLVGTSFPDKKQQVEATRAAGLKAVRESWIVLGAAAAVGIYIAMWLLLPAVLMVLLHLGGLAVFIAMSLNTGARMSAPFSKVSNAVGAARPSPESASLPLSPHQGRAYAFSPIEGSVTGFSGVSNTAPVRVREWFPETLLWRPQVITDEHGRASIDMDLADSITTWRLTASAVTADGRLGAAKLPIRVFQPFFVDLNLPVALTRGDEVAVPVVVYNYLNKPQTVELTFAAADWYERLDEAVQRIELAAGEVRSTAYRLRAKRVGNHQLEVTAHGAGVADAVKRPVEVVPDGHRVEQVFNGNLLRPAEVHLTVPEAAIEGSPRAILKLYPSGFSQLVEGLDGIFQMPHGCFEQTSSTTYPNVLALDYLRRTHKSIPEVEAKARQYIHLGYQRLLSFEVSGGGFDWFGHPPANLTLTAYGLMEFQDMARVHDVDPRLIERTRAWLLRQRQADGSWIPNRGMLHEDPTHGGADQESARLSTTAYVAWAVFGGQPAGSEAKQTLDYLLSHTPAAITDAHGLALVANALLALDPRGEYAGPYLDRLESMKRTSADDKLTWWEQPTAARTTFYGSGRSGQIETTALATLALIHGNRHPDTARRALAWLVSQKGPAGTWYSTQATVLALKALLAGTTNPLGEERERRLTLTWDRGQEREVVIPADQAEVMKQVDLSAFLTPGPHRLTITERGGSGIGYQLAFRYHVPGSRPDQREALGIRLAYDRTDLVVGDTVTATAIITNQTAQTAPMVLVDLPVPAGFALVAEDLERLVQSGGIAKFQVTPRQAIVYLRGLQPGKSLSLRYRLRATMPVKVTVPAALVYEYYAPDNKAQTQPLRITVAQRGR